MLDRIYDASKTNIKAQITLCCFALIVVIIIINWIGKIIGYCCRKNGNVTQLVKQVKNEKSRQGLDNLKRLSTPKNLTPTFFASLNNDYN